jgi:HEPN domain-containing protein
MNRVDFQNLSLERLADAKALFAAGRHACAYYVAGYAVECALKACIANKTIEDDFPPRDANRYWTHDLESLLDSAGLRAEVKSDSSLEISWAIVKDWSESSRYETRSDRGRARLMLDAITDPQIGILQWLKNYW